MAKSFAHLVQEKCAQYGDTRSHTFLVDTREGWKANLRTFAQIDQRAREIAELLSRQTTAGARALLLFPSGPDFIEAFLGCLYAGVVAVPAPEAQFSGSTDRLAGIVEDADLRVVLTTSEIREVLTPQLTQAGLTHRVTTCLATDVDQLGDAAKWRQPELAADALAFIQYTSGSTSQPKGVMVTHANLLHNCAVLASAWEMDDTHVFAGWLPHFHDMGLIGMLLTPFARGMSVVHCAPLTFVKRPFRWLEMISRFGATHTTAPDFAYDLCTRSVTDEQLGTLDLSSLQCAGSGAEPVRVATADAFAARFTQAGLRREALYAGYGLAEATLVIASGRIHDDGAIRHVEPLALERHEVELVAPGCGTTLVGHGRPAGCELVIVEPDTMVELPKGRVGEIWVGGPSVAAGYWNQPELSQEVFQTRTSAGNGPFLRTGDLGFLLDGSLYVTGRRKDVIIVQGRNIYPQDIEQAARRLHPALAARTGAAFTVATDRDHVVLVQEVRRNQFGSAELAELAGQIRQSLVGEFDIPFPSIVLVDRAVPRTTSGKVQRRATRDLFCSGDLAPIHEDLHPSLATLRQQAGVRE